MIDLFTVWGELIDSPFAGQTVKMVYGEHLAALVLHEALGKGRKHDNDKSFRSTNGSNAREIISSIEPHSTVISEVVDRPVKDDKLGLLSLESVDGGWMRMLFSGKDLRLAELGEGIAIP